MGARTAPTAFAREDDDGPVTLRRPDAPASGERDVEPARDRNSDRDSGTRLCSPRSERETLRPSQHPIAIEHIHLGVSVDELLYRIEMGDIAGALSVAMPLLDDDYIPYIIMPDVVLSAVPTSGREDYVLSMVDGFSTMTEIVDMARFSTLETLRTFCELIDKGIVGLR